MNTFHIRLSLAVLCVASHASAQWICSNSQWHPYGVVEGTNNIINTMSLWDPDGKGPADQTLLVGGAFTKAGNQNIRYIATYDVNTDTWGQIGDNLSDDVNTIKPLDDGQLLVGGDFEYAGSTRVNGIARWDGSTWLPLGTGIAGNALTYVVGLVHAIEVMPNGDVIAGGSFAEAGGLSVQNVARWDGVQWTSLGDGLGWTSIEWYPIVYALKAMPNGDLFAGGFFDVYNGEQNHGIARWNGTEWSPLGPQLSGGDVRAIQSLPSGDLLVMGSFSSIGGVSAKNIARWDGTDWYNFGAGCKSRVHSTTLLDNGDVIAGGKFKESGGVSTRLVARWDGQNWSPLGFGIAPTSGTVTSMVTLPDGNLAVGGYFTYAGGAHVAKNIAFYGCRSACDADCDLNGTLNIFDYICFGSAFANSDPYADCDNDGYYSITDYICFGTYYASGCP
ncbi:MAG: hypothetical protein H6815_04660 [Phycisphaeraceae bacterium]|nr:hypothetical protein [Phycisphaerales bacterium]MCB9859725.1 hypothetical protein [Phycisphaeraceae bacterium]